jgi:DNA-3-methyladenine glycosylase
VDYSSLFKLPTLSVAQELLGWEIIHETPEGIAGGIITETEAYLHDDPASHSFRGPTPRTLPMFGKAGHAYVYRSYGLHFCFNIVTSQKDQGEAILIRALEPSKGIPLMRLRRKQEALANLCSGPGKICQALNITLKENNLSLHDSSLRLTGRLLIPESITATSRIGISQAKEHPYRFYITHSPYTSRRNPHAATNLVKNKAS